MKKGNEVKNSGLNISWRMKICLDDLNFSADFLYQNDLVIDVSEQKGYRGGSSQNTEASNGSE